MRCLGYSINLPSDGCCDHRAIIPVEDLHRHAPENLAQAAWITRMENSTKEIGR